MTSSISTTSASYSEAIDSIRSEVEAYCEANGIDPDEYLNNLDGNLQAGVYDNATFESYFQVAYMQLMEILYPEVINSIEAEVGSNVNFDTLYENSDEDITDLLSTILREDDPQLVAYFNLLESGESESDAVTSLLNNIYASGGSSSGEDRSFTEDAQSLEDQYGFGNWYQGAIDKEEAFKAAEMSILDQLNDYSSRITEISTMLDSGQISEVEATTRFDEATFGQQALMGMLQSITEEETKFFEMMTKLLDKQLEMQMSVINNFRGA